MKSGKTRAQENREIRQEALRQSLVAGGHIQHVIDICEELNDLTIELDAVSVQRKRAVIDTKLKLVNKYLPDLKSTEIKNAEGEEFKTSGSVQIVFNPVGAND
jgi:hypothetical protein